MCGITGAVWGEQGSAITQATLERMTWAIRHRGPDDSAHEFGSGCKSSDDSLMSVALGFRRLSIIDLEGAKQPLKNEDKSLWLIFNGEIYNFVELRKKWWLGVIGFHRMVMVKLSCICSKSTAQVVLVS